MSTTLLPGAKFLTYQMLQPFNQHPKTIPQKINTKSQKYLGSGNKSRKINVPKLKKSETHRNLRFIPKKYQMLRKNSNEDGNTTTRSHKNIGNVKLRKKLVHKFNKNDSMYNNKTVVTSSKYFQTKSTNQIVKWKDYVQNLKIK
jgi:hypothetical protein